jgi:hypothetical protein
MKKRSRPRGRPKNNEGIVPFWRFARAGIVMCVYDEARKRGEKHSTAVNQAVKYVRQHRTEMPISETEVKRTLAAFRPRHGRIILRFKRSTISKKKLMQLRSIQKQLANLKGKKDSSSIAVPNLPKSRVSYTFSFEERPLYPRHNRKIPNE